MTSTPAKPFRIGLLGLGTVGQGVIRLLAQNGDEIARRTGRDLVVTHASVRNRDASRDVDTRGVHIGTDPNAIVHADVDAVVEVMGGIEPAKSLVLSALARGKPVITANKALLAEHGNELFRAAERTSTMLTFEASVAGGIPIIKVLREGLAGNRIRGVAGIINGTCNYILTQMSRRGLPFVEALAEAQKLGYAEADPTFDVEGIDAAHKLTLLASLAFGIPLNFSAVTTEGIGRVQTEDLILAKEMGYRIKSLGIARQSERGVELRVHPALVPSSHILARTDGALNAVCVQGNGVGETVYVGRGAGGGATASAIVADLIDVARLADAKYSHRVPFLGFGNDQLRDQKMLPLSEVESAYYLRLRVADEPGVLRAITSILAELDISIEAIIQKEPREHEDATLAIITSQVREHRCDSALEKMQRLPFVRSGAARIRVADFDE